MKTLIRHKFIIAGIVLGLAGGFLYYKFVGCVDGTCAITSNPLYSSLYGAILGGLLLSIFKNPEEKTQKINDN